MPTAITTRRERFSFIPTDYYDFDATLTTIKCIGGTKDAGGGTNLDRRGAEPGTWHTAAHQVAKPAVVEYLIWLSDLHHGEGMTV